MRKNKYNAKKTIINGIKFDSKREAKRYTELRLLEKQGKIKHLRLQVPYVLVEKSKYGREIKYIADFVYKKLYTFTTIDCVTKIPIRVTDWVEIVEDTKGFRTDLYRLKKRLLAEKYEIEIKEV